MSENVVSFESARKREAIRKSIRTLYASGIDGLLPLGELVLHCRNPNHPIGGEEKKILKQHNLIDSDGVVPPAVKEIVLKETTNGKFLEPQSGN